MRTKLLVVCMSVVLLACPVANGQVEDTFEEYAGSADGVELNGQGDYYNPVPKTSASAKIYTYAGNVLGLPENPSGGGLQFVAGTGPGDGFFARSQRDFTYGDGTGVWVSSYDLAVTFVGDLPSVDNVGSFSGQPFEDEKFGDAATIIHLITWTDPDTAVNWNAGYVWFDAGDGQLNEQIDDPGFQGLEVNHWYRLSTAFDFDTNEILGVSITDKETGETAANQPSGRYLDGGEAGGLPTPTGFRLFAGNSAQFGNVLALDNLTIEPVEVVCGDGNCSILLGEDCCDCAADCGACECGDGNCDTPCEDGINCGADCHPCTGAGGECCLIFECSDGSECDPDDKDTCPDTGGPGDCDNVAENDTAGCDDFTCCDALCSFDEFCCFVLWDSLCAEQAAAICQLCGAAGPHLISTGGEGRSHDGYLEITPGEYGSWATMDFGGGAFGGPGDNFNPAGPLTEKEAAFTAGIMMFVGDDQRILLGEYHQWEGGLPLPPEGLSKQITTANDGSDTNDDGAEDTLTSAFDVTGTGVDLSFALTQHVYTVIEGVSSELEQVYVITNNGDAVDFTLVVTFDGDFLWDEDEDFEDDEVGTTTNARGGAKNSVFEQEEGDPATRVTVHSPEATVYYGAKLGIDPSECESGGVAYGFGTDFQIWDAFGVPDGSDDCDPHECSDETPCDPDDVGACPDTGGQEDCDPTNPPDASDWRNHIANVGYDTDGASTASPPDCGAPCDASCGVQINVSLAASGVTNVTIFHTYGAEAVAEVCGNGKLEGSEECDDGNTDDGDCCSSSCTTDDDGTECDDGNDCTLDDQCTGGACGGTDQQRAYADICGPFCPPSCAQPGIDDILCILDDFASGHHVLGCPGAGCQAQGGPQRGTTDLHPCPEEGAPCANDGDCPSPPDPMHDPLDGFCWRGLCRGDGELNIDDILKMLDAFAQNPGCPAPCP